MSTEAADVAMAATATRAGRDCGSHRATVSRAATCQGTNTGTCDMHPVGERMRRGEVRDVFQGIDDEPRLFDLGAAVVTIANVGLQGCNPEAHLVIEEEIDLVWKQVPVIHEVLREGSTERGLRLFQVDVSAV